MASGKGKDPRTDRKYAAQRPGEAKGLAKGEVVGHTWHERLCWPNGYYPGFYSHTPIPEATHQ